MNVLHIFRAPVGGLFRHVCDLAEQQSKLGLNVGIVCAADSGGDNAAKKLQQLEPLCKLGIHRLPMSRSLGFADFQVVHDLPKIFEHTALNIIHGHGAKGGAYARILAKQLNAKSVYTPHGGSLHYSIKSPVGAIYLGLEWYLKKITHGVIFESQYSADVYQQKIGRLVGAYKVIHNGLREQEFSVLSRPAVQNQFVFVGEIRKLKGLDCLFQAMQLLQKQVPAKLLVFGAGPDEEFFHQRVAELGISDVVSFNPPIFPATEAFKLAHCIVVPSLAESFPYIVLEAAAAKVPLLTTQVGGIPEIFGPFAGHLLPAGEPEPLALAMQQVIQHPDTAEHLADQLYDFVHTNFTFTLMVENTIAFYQEILNP